VRRPKPGGASPSAIAVANWLGHDIPHPIGDPDEDEELPGDEDEDEDEDDDDDEPLQASGARRSMILHRNKFSIFLL
jgi:hypothetical protein